MPRSMRVYPTRERPLTLIDTTPLITHRYSLEDIEEAYRVFENREDGVIKVAIDCLCLKSN